MPTPTYTLIDSVTLTSTSSQVDFSSIPADYGDLVLVVSGKSSSTSMNIQMKLNNTSQTSAVWAYGTGSGTGSSSSSSLANGYFENTKPSNTIAQIMDYTSSNHKTALIRIDSAGRGNTFMEASRFALTSVVNEINVVALYDTFASGMTFFLYGIEA